MKAGYNFYFFSFLGVRGYLDYQYGFSVSSQTETEQNQTTTTGSKFSLHHITFNVDLLANFLNTDSFSLGGFVGIGLGYGHASNTTANVNTSTTTKLADGFILPVNVGLSIIASGHHRLDFGVRIPTIAMNAAITTNNNANNRQNSYRYLLTTIGYSYNF
ncbi:outer membrane beta-barrel protein [Helicobacter saguini]|uniref:Outer membrane beta-barrel protein n=1 Tax=Helicobacter saguini TaxID=1548018 RepID=A0A6B0HPW8_9HELI|nr:outer membrane beta-barrel protein [Helicobacter saguini]MWV61338.1 outer membrane beta-barrel protein [Helicobacter saguini]MWV67992.1 outer membrane beta-barrel protein [Helicobacter saguini]MWV70540.1 outer membrane beta-barrel protein [Helicobacter saguini]MWV72444.1 outer membrane beta-barrel protein [Helicobacter saguini]